MFYYYFWHNAHKATFAAPTLAAACVEFQDFYGFWPDTLTVTYEAVA